MKEHNFNKPQGKTQIQPTRKQKVVRGRPSPESVSTETSISNRKRKVRKKKWSVKKKIMLIIPIVLLILFLGGCLAFQYIFGGLNVREITIDPVELGVDTSASEKSKEYKITNIALFGVDSRNPNRNVGRSDSIIILSVDQKNNILKMTSILRDSKVKIEGHGEEKITHAYAYGGPELAIKTLNENFHLDIQDYATVNFSQLANVVDAMGGIDIEITDGERAEINKNLKDQSTPSEEVTKSGLVHLNGAQATAYARIRYIGSDTARADRQKKVLECLLSNVKSLSVTDYPKLLNTIMPMVETSLSYTDIIGYAPMLLKDLPVEQNSIPSEEDHAVGGGNPWVWSYDLEKASERLHTFIYGSENETNHSVEE